jgi:hypothetical protein
MLRLVGGQVESLLDELLPVEVRELPADLATLDRLLGDPCLLAPIEQAWEQTARDHGRPTIPMASFVRLMVVKQRTGWGYATLVRGALLHRRRPRPSGETAAMRTRRRCNSAPRQSLPGRRSQHPPQHRRSRRRRPRRSRLAGHGRARPLGPSTDVGAPPT